MGISSIPGILGTGPANAPHTEREVEPAFELTRSNRMQEDDYHGNQESAERGMEEEDTELDESANSDETLSNTEDSDNRVNFFA